MIKSDIGLICLGEGKVKLENFRELLGTLIENKDHTRTCILSSGTSIKRTLYTKHVDYKVLEIINS